jgi:REP element-mobilizing transposase RayT
MPRQARIDAPGAIHHIIVRGIERRKIFRDDADRIDFLERFGTIASESSTGCYAWSLIPNHFHLLLKTGRVPIATVMRRLLTGYAMGFNRRHKRRGHLFQNRYKSILCQEDAYLKELVRYIHLNPLRAQIVQGLKELDRYSFCGHAVIMGKKKNDWQTVKPVLEYFHGNRSTARRRYRKFVIDGIEQGRRKDLIGGGLIRSAGGWGIIKSLRKAGEFLKSDERILGDSDFVEQVLRDANEAMERKYILASRGVDIERLIDLACELQSIAPESVIGPGKERKKVKARRLICYWAVNELGLSMAVVSKKLAIALPTVSLSFQKGEKICREDGLDLPSLLNIEI